jgi:hypothetical protein
MDSEGPRAENPAANSRQLGGGPEQLPQSSSPGGTAAQELAYMEQLLTADRGVRWSKSLTADELLMIGSEVFAPLFREPPVGPIPEYLAFHWSVHGCVAEYEEQLEEIDRWKARELNRWLKARIGKQWCVAGKMYELEMERKDAATPERFRFRLIEDSTGCHQLTLNES